MNHAHYVGVAQRLSLYIEVETRYILNFRMRIEDQKLECWSNGKRGTPLKISVTFS